MSIEDRLRDALQATAGTVDDQIHRPLPERTPAPSPLKRRLIPIGAVVAVLLVLAGFVTAQRLWGDPAPRLQRTPHMPKFIFVSTSAGDDGRPPAALEVRDSATGRLIDRQLPPRGISYGDVAALGDNRTFYVASESEWQKRCQTTIQRVTVSEAGKIIGLEPIPGGPVAGTGTGDGGLAVTPNGTKLAYSVTDCTGDSGRIVVIDLASNTRRKLNDSAPGYTSSDLSWTADGNRLFFVRRLPVKDPRTREGGKEELRTVDVSTPGVALLLTNSRLIQTLRSPYTYSSALASPDGRSVITSSEELVLGVASSERGDGPKGTPSPSRLPNAPLELLELSAQDGRTLRRIRVAGAANLSISSSRSDASGSYLLTGSGIVDLHQGVTARPMKGFDRITDLDW